MKRHALRDGQPGALVALALAVPLLADVPGAFSSGAVLRAGVLAVVLPAALLLAGLQWTGPLPTRGRLVLAVLPLGVALLALPATSGEGLFPALRALGPWCALALLPLVLARALPTAGARRVAEAGTRLASVAAIAWVALDGLAAWPRAAVGPFGRPGVAGPVVAALGLALLGARARRARLVPALAIAAATLLALGLTRSRTAAVAAAAGALVLLALPGDGAAARIRRRAAAGLGAALAVLVALAVADVVPVPGGTATLDVRRGLARASAALVTEAPLGGHGLGRFGEEVLRVRDPVEARHEAGRRPTHAHDDVLNVAVEAGVPAALLFLAFLLGALRHGVRTARAAGEEDRGAAAGWTAAIATLAVAGLGDGVVIDPAGVVVLVAALVFLDARAARAAPAPATRGAVRLRQGAWIAALVLAVPAWAHVRGVRADRALVRWLDEGSAALAAGDLVRADVLMERHLVHVARALEPGDARVWYQIGVQHARRGRRPAAAEALRTALRLDPGMTEARLDLATVQEIEERPQDAAVTLEEARRQDPTRFDVALRLGHLALGDEPVPGEPGADLDIETVLRRYNEAQRIDPTQPANLVAQARVARRLGDLAGAGIALRAAQRQLGGDLPTLPAELLQESFRLAELEGTDEAVACGILTWALRRRPTSAGRILREAERFLALGREREEATKAAVDPDVLGAGGRLDLSDAQRAYDAAARRLAALLLSGLESPAPHLAAARQDAEARLWRRALARYRALLAWTQVDPGAGEHDLPVLLEALARRGDLLVEAAQVAQRVDARLARTYFTRGHALIGAELLAAGEIEHALRLLKGVVEDDPDAAELRLAYARALARHGDLDDAERQLLTALAQDPHLREAAAATTDLVSLRDRPRVRAALAR